MIEIAQDHVSERPDITVVIPVYDGAEYLSQTLESLLQQKFTNFEVIVVDDGSSDDSVRIIKSYEARDSRIVALNTVSNLGIVPKVLEFALPYMRGKYFAYASQDDLFSDDWLLCMYRRAVETGAEAVVPRMIEYHDDSTVPVTEWYGIDGNSDTTLSGREAVVLSLNWTIHGFILWNLDVIRKIGFFVHGMYADEYSVRVFLLACNKIVFSDGTFYYRKDNSNAITVKRSFKHFDKALNHILIYKFLKANEFSKIICHRELAIAVNVLVGHGMDFARFSKIESPLFLSEVRRRLFHGFSELSNPALRSEIKQVKGVRSKITYQVLRGNFGVFLIFCRIVNFARGLRSSMSTRLALRIEDEGLTGG